MIFFVLDDVGYGQLSCFGGLVEAPNIDRVAAMGLRYANMHTTALCSPSRGCTLTGRNHHTLGLSAVTEFSVGFPGHNGYMGFEHGMLSEMLLEHGYNTFALGKWHLTPPEETTMAGPLHRWPVGRGFERYYGFLGGDTDQWFPDLTHDQQPIEPPYSPEEGYHLNIDLADKAIGFIKDAHHNAPDKPFFLYYATGAGHAPHQVEPEWIESYRGKFDMGWDEYRKVVFERQKEMGIVPPDTELSERDPDVAAWDSLSDDEQRMYSRQMEVYAGFITQTDHHFGRIVDFLEKLGELDNTLIVVVSDNGASAEGGVNGTRNEMISFNNAPETLEDNLEMYDEWGGVNTFPHYSWGWTWAGDTPFRRWKRETYRGGITDPCVVCWPAGIRARGEMRTQYAHVIDLVPTMLDAIGLQAPTELRGVVQSPLQGVSFAHTFDDADAATEHHTQYFEMFGHRSIYHDGWRAVCPWPGPNFADAAEQGRFFGLTPLTAEVLEQLDAEAWELYHAAEDPTETRNLNDEHPEKLQEMIQRWYTEAGRYQVLPLISADLQRMNTPRPTTSRPRSTFTYYPGGVLVPFAAAPRVYNRPHTITANVELTEEGAEGVLLAHGNRHGGYSFYIKDGYLHHVHNYLGLERFTVSSPDPVPTGEVELRYEFEPTGEPDFPNGKGTPGRSQLYVNRELVASIELPYTVPNTFGIIGLTCGRDGIDAVDPGAYGAPYTFTGEINEVILDLSGDLIFDEEAAVRQMVARQ